MLIGGRLEVKVEIGEDISGRCDQVLLRFTGVFNGVGGVVVVNMEGMCNVVASISMVCV